MSLILPKPYRVCDICGREIGDFEKRYTIKSKHLFMRRSRRKRQLEVNNKMDMCFHCMSEFRRFVAAKRRKGGE